MALKTATRIGGDFLDLRELAANGPVLVVFRILEFLPAELDNFRKNTYPVRADVFIVDGPSAGQVHQDELFKFAPANVLRGVSAKDSDQGAAPVNAVGDEIASRIKIVTGKGQPFAGLDEPSAAEMVTVQAAYNAAGGPALWTTQHGAGTANGAIPSQRPF